MLHTLDGDFAYRSVAAYTAPKSVGRRTSTDSLEIRPFLDVHHRAPASRQVMCPHRVISPGPAVANLSAVDSSRKVKPDTTLITDVESPRHCFLGVTRSDLALVLEKETETFVTSFVPGVRLW